MPTPVPVANLLRFPEASQESPPKLPWIDVPEIVEDPKLRKDTQVPLRPSEPPGLGDSALVQADGTPF